MIKLSMGGPNVITRVLIRGEQKVRVEGDVMIEADVRAGHGGSHL